MVPYEESIADLLENEYKQAVESGEWHKKIVLSMNEQVTFHGPTVIVHFQQQQSSDAWGGTSVSWILLVLCILERLTFFFVFAANNDTSTCG